MDRRERAVDGARGEGEQIAGELHVRGASAQQCVLDIGPKRQRTADRGWREASGRVGDWCSTPRAQLVGLGPTVWRVGPTVWRMHTGVWRPPRGRGADFRYCY